MNPYTATGKSLASSTPTEAPANGITSATGGSNFAEVAFAFRISGVSLAIGMALAVVMGIAGGVLPAFRASRLPITSALRDA